MASTVSTPNVDLNTLRREISKEYAEVAENPQKGFHFHAGRRLAEMLGYDKAMLDWMPRGTLESFAGTGNPFSLGALKPGKKVVDVGSGAGFDSLISARMVGPLGRVIGVDMTPEMLKKARAGAAQAGLENVSFKQGLAESLPVEDGWADVVTSNGVVNLCPDKSAVFREMFRVLKPGGRLQIGDILVQKEVPQSAKDKIDLWTG
ncbi:MAG: methyltransferase domain-containing protein [SAR202 cluster bacterium]|nr:methyltransferase domain-containing protein [SAR202 cluster bacterium]